jgi:hypothetical protein
MKQKVTESKEVDSSIMIVWDFSTPLSIMDRLTRQKTNKETEGLNNPLNQVELADNL